jgi:tRNA(adenine34) deaminase
MVSSAWLAQPPAAAQASQEHDPGGEVVGGRPPAPLSEAILHAMTGDPPGGIEQVPTAPMALAIERAREAEGHGDVPIGAVIARDGEVLAAAGNERELRGDPTAHAEILALREASAALGGWRLVDTVLYVTLEPCAMCAGAIVLARVPRVVWAADDPKAGAAGSVMNVLAEPRLNHRPEAAGGLLAEDAADLLRAFFASRR